MSLAIRQPAALISIIDAARDRRRKRAEPS